MPRPPSPLPGQPGRTLILAVLVGLAAVGCRPPEDDAEPAVVPKAVTFDGKVDARFVGTWATADGNSKLAMTKDGDLTISTSTPSPSGRSTASYEGRWLVSGNLLRLRYSDQSGESTIEYNAALDGKKLVLQQPGGRLKTTYLRK